MEYSESDQQFAVEIIGGEYFTADYVIELYAEFESEAGVERYTLWSQENDDFPVTEGDVGLY